MIGSRRTNNSIRILPARKKKDKKIYKASLDIIFRFLSNSLSISKQYSTNFWLLCLFKNGIRSFYYQRFFFTMKNSICKKILQGVVAFETVTEVAFLGEARGAVGNP